MRLIHNKFHVCIKIILKIKVQVKFWMNIDKWMDGLFEIHILLVVYNFEVMFTFFIWDLYFSLGRFIQLSNNISEMVFFLTWCLTDKFSPRISAFHLDAWRFMASNNFSKEVRIKVEFSELSLRPTMIHFWKSLSMEDLIFSKVLKRPNTKSSKITGLSRTFLA